MKPIISLIVLTLLASVQPVLGQSVDQPQILFQAWDGDDADVYIIDADGQNLHPLTDNDFFDGTPSWSPDGQQIVFVSNRDDTKDDIYLDYGIYTMDTDGQNVKLIVDNVNYEAEASWSPDGKSIAVMADEGPEGQELNCVVSIMKPDGSERQPVFTAPYCDSFLARWSPDSSRVLVNANGSIYSVRLSDSSALQLTPDTSDNYAPVWSPDGSKVAYIFDQHESSENYEVYLMNADGSGQKRLTDNPAADVAPRFTADGKSLLFSSGDDKANELYLYNLETGTIEQLTDSKTQKFWWILSPDSSKAIYTEHPSTSKDQIYLLDIQTGTSQPLVDKVFESVGHYSW